MGIIAENAYYNNRYGRNNSVIEKEEEKLKRKMRERNQILSEIQSIEDAMGYIKQRNAIIKFGKENSDTEAYELRKKLDKRIETVMNDLNKKIEKLTEEIEIEKNKTWHEETEVLEYLHRQAEHRMYEIMLKLGTNDVTLKRQIGAFVSNADRIDAIALTKIAFLPQYEKYFTPRYKDMLAEKVKSKAEIIFEQNKQPILEEKGRELAKYYMRLLNLRNAVKKISYEENQYYFKNET